MAALDRRFNAGSQRFLRGALALAALCTVALLIGGALEALPGHNLIETAVVIQAATKGKGERENATANR